jgi:hypothetical protein
LVPSLGCLKINLEGINQEDSMWDFDFRFEVQASDAWRRRKLERKLEKVERTIRDEFELGREEACPVLMRRALELRVQLEG